jgi:hypothetical protein
MLSTILLVSGLSTAVIGFGAAILGFGAAGIVAGSVASGMQAGIGNVVAGSAFAKLTSMGMLGYFTNTAIGGTILTALGFLA